MVVFHPGNIESILQSGIWDTWNIGQQKSQISSLRESFSFKLSWSFGTYLII